MDAYTKLINFLDEKSIEKHSSNCWLDGMRRIRIAIEWDYWEISRKAQERAGLIPIIPSYMREARNH
jgi:hypothetical protein